MLLNQETLRLVFGLKLKGLRLERDLSLKDLAKKTGLSPSYLNEIEKGKKYPKTEKILILAEALNEKLEDLISLELKKEFQLIQQLLDKKFLTGIPFDIFGIPSNTLFSLLAERPKKMQALVGTLLEIARAHQIGVDDLLYALLRSYLDMHNNYFPGLEDKANQARQKFQILWNLKPAEIYMQLLKVLKESYKVKIFDQVNFLEVFKFESEVNYFVLDKGQVLYISEKLDLKEKILILSRELGYHFLKLKVRPPSSLTVQLDSFEQLFNHFSASYFASSLLLPEDEVKNGLDKILKQTQWSKASFLELAHRFACPMESFFHRMTQILPKNFSIGQLFYLRYEYDRSTKKYQVAKELHLSSLHSPHKIKGNENYCNRWLIHQLTTQRLNAKEILPESLVGVQRSAYVASKNEYLILASAFQNPFDTQKISCVCLGLLVNQNLEQNVRFLSHPQILKVQVGETCQRCTLIDCSDREAALDPKLNPNRFQQIFEKINELEKNH